MKENQYQFRLSIIVAIYNVEAYLERCLSSVVKQDLRPEEYEILLINDGSTDRSLAIAQKYERLYSNVKVFSKENGGLSSVRNFGIDHSQGRYIMHVDGDDFLVENVVGKVVKVAEENDLDLCFFRFIGYPDRWHADNFSGFPHYKVLNGEDMLLNGMKVSSTWCGIYSHDLIKALGIRFYDRISHQDVEYNYRLYPFAKRLMFTDFYVYNYVVEGESISRTNDIKKIKKNLLDDLIIIKNLKCFAANGNISKPVRKLINHRMNSTLVSLMMSFLKRNNKVGYIFVRDFINKAQTLSQYPIRGITCSWKTTILIPFINVKCLYLAIAKIVNNK